ncbi:MAG: hypothetical protein HYZ84_06980 [Candidatus Omnitrophica bacterium]|nr:hypothetical protein [Candidatus Omnitrophota bacterium]
MNSQLNLKMLFAAVLMAVAMTLTLPGYAKEIVRQTETTTTVTVRDDIPLYTGPVVEAELEELGLEDFQRLGSKPPIAQGQFQEYKEEGRDPNSTKPRLYKMKVTHDLALVDFQGADIDPRIAQVRYEGYVTAYKSKPGEPYYVYVYHTPLVRATAIPLAQ